MGPDDHRPRRAHHDRLLAAAGSEYEFAPAAEPVLRPLVDGQALTLADLAAAASLEVDDVAALVGELVDGQAAAVSNVS
ncbi:hypothetical protein OG936_36880 [Streptomyces sp. NBC_00846]|uniref:winged helix domain-containing protein n=1 Tax=Streptomyces sp. NBC_00846 TaxID=2975849 RepID=UPI00386A0D16|nr:hypothetical protein OG936_36880 [Streptomyces sp. NBC_00846]